MPSPGPPPPPAVANTTRRAAKNSTARPWPGAKDPTQVSNSVDTPALNKLLYVFAPIISWFTWA